MKAAIYLFFVLLPIFAQALPKAPSAGRPREVSWKQLARELRPKNIQLRWSTAVDTAVPVPEIDLHQVKKWKDYAQIEKQFKAIRDLKFVPDVNSHFRRSTWLYPDDGCYARAALAVENLKAFGHSKVQKIFVFGDLYVKTPNAPSGYVSWWYHVAPVVREKNNVYVLDPSIDHHKPLKIQDWLNKMGGSKNLSINICNGNTYEPYGDCYTPDLDESASALEDQRYFLPHENQRLLDLGRKPQLELGDFPPWLNP